MVLQRKVEYIKKTSLVLKTQYNYDIPNTVEQLCSLSGVGPKMAYLVMRCAWNQIEGLLIGSRVYLEVVCTAHKYCRMVLMLFWGEIYCYIKSNSMAEVKLSKISVFPNFVL